MASGHDILAKQGFHVKSKSHLVGQLDDGRYFVFSSSPHWTEGDQLPAQTDDDRYFDSWDEALAHLKTKRSSHEGGNR